MVKKATAVAAQDLDPKNAQLSRFQKYRIERVHRNVMKNAPYNPRFIDDYNKEKLRKNLKKVGLLEAVTWNCLSGNLVGGHQRLAILDALEGHGNYLLDVCVVELSDKDEVEQNIALNNPNLAGDWDLPLLGEALKTRDLELGPTGFDPSDLQVMFEDKDLASLFEPNQEAKQLLNESLALKPEPKSRSTSENPEAPAQEGEAEETQAAPAKTPTSKQPPLDRKESVKNWQEFRDQVLDSELYVVVIFKSRDERERFVQSIGYKDKDERYIEGARVKHHMGIKEE